MGIADSMKKAAFSTAFSYIGKNPEIVRTSSRARKTPLVTFT